MNITEFASKHVTLTVARVASNPYMLDAGPHMNRHWRCVLRAKDDGRRHMTVFFSQGDAHKREPSVTDLLECLASDAAGVENAQDFADWAADLYGHLDDDEAVSRCRRTFKLIGRQMADLKRVLGPEHYETLLWQMEHKE